MKMVLIGFVVILVLASTTGETFDENLADQHNDHEIARRAVRRCIPGGGLCSTGRGSRARCCGSNFVCSCYGHQALAIDGFGRTTCNGGSPRCIRLGGK